MNTRTVLNLWPLLFGVALIGLVVGVQGSLLGIRASLEGFSNGEIGLVTSMYFVGFVVGSSLTPRLIASVGHIRTFAALAALASMSILVHVLFIEPWVWGLLRLTSGFSLSGIYVITESWLNQQSDNSNRGRVLSIYMIILLGGNCAGQYLLLLAEPGEFQLFSLVSVLVSFAAVPILLSVTRAPATEDVESFSLRKLYRLAPIGFVGIVIVQFCWSILFGMGAVYAIALGMSTAQVANFMALLMAGGIVGQWPLGRLSDVIDRRLVISASMFMAAVSAYLLARSNGVGSTYWFTLVFVLGVFCMPAYSLLVALVNDFLKPAQIVRASGTIVLLSGLSSVGGPYSVALVMNLFGTQSFSLLLCTLFALLGSIALFRALFVPYVPEEWRVPAHVHAPGVSGTGYGDGEVEQ